MSEWNAIVAEYRRRYGLRLLSLVEQITGRCTNLWATCNWSKATASIST